MKVFRRAAKLCVPAIVLAGCWCCLCARKIQLL